MSIQHKLGNLWFWLGTQGYEDVDLGRLWQILLFQRVMFIRPKMPFFGVTERLGGHNSKHSAESVLQEASREIPLSA